MRNFTTWIALTFWAPGKIASVKAQGTVLHIATTRAHQVNALRAKLEEKQGIII